jgi:hypothetical protein
MLDLTFYLFVWVVLILLALPFCRFWQGGKSTQQCRNRRDASVSPNRLQASRASSIVRRVIRKSGLNRRDPTHLHPL